MQSTGAHLHEHTHASKHATERSSRGVMMADKGACPERQLLHQGAEFNPLTVQQPPCYLHMDI